MRCLVEPKRQLPADRRDPVTAHVAGRLPLFRHPPVQGRPDGVRIRDGQRTPSWLMESLATVGLAIVLFVATNIDDVLVLLGFFADPGFRARHIVVGQYLGIGALVL